jgi:hypothetical protein
MSDRDKIEALRETPEWRACVEAALDAAEQQTGSRQAPTNSLRSSPVSTLPLCAKRRRCSNPDVLLDSRSTSA